ncbi:MAG TPA: ectonucleotide pyrophosphatase/phosphodiesterase [Cyclobacteriaceae bacterium]|nr:ectonucleotide pyrophosphatase/phosphodiesterase [Cyclobacteriaceae bacterium]
MKRLICVITLIGLMSAVLKAQDTPYVILVSFDGFRHDYVTRYDLPNFQAFLKRGSQARGLLPSFPSKTFPNHYSLVTGLYPGNHGLVNNEFYDPDREEHYSMEIVERLRDPYYYGGTPLWKLAREHNIKTASYFWIGSEIPDEGHHPDYYYHYDEEIPFAERVDQVLAWLQLPEQDRPHFIALYFSSPDHEAHLYGPLSPQVEEALLDVDAMLGKLMAGVDASGLPVNVILVSDHGLKELEFRNETFVFLDEILDVNNTSIVAVNAGSQVHFYLRDAAQRDSLAAALKAGATKYDVVLPERFPRRWRFGHKRSGDLLLVARPGYYFRDKDRTGYMKKREHAAKFGVHGYDPDVEADMMGIFYASGPNIQPGVTVPAFRNIHVYPLVARILRMQTPEIDGKFSVLKRIYREPVRSRAAAQ